MPPRAPEDKEVRASGKDGDGSMQKSRKTTNSVPQIGPEAPECECHDAVSGQQQKLALQDDESCMPVCPLKKTKVRFPTLQISSLNCHYHIDVYHHPITSHAWDVTIMCLHSLFHIRISVPLVPIRL